MLPFIKKRLASWLFRLCLICVGAYIMLPFLVGLWQAIVGSVGYLPLLNMDQINVDAWKFWFIYKGNLLLFWRSFIVALGTTFLSVVLSFFIISSISLHLLYSRVVSALLVIILSMPHLAIASGIFAFYSAGGMFERVLCLFTKCSTADLQILETSSLAVIGATFLLKEMPFVLFISLAALKALPVKQITELGRSLGYSNYRIYQTMILPQVYPKIRLMLFSVLAYSLTSVEVPLVFETLNSKLLASEVLKMFYNPRNLTDYAKGLSGSLLLILLFLLLVGVWILGEKLLTKFFTYRLRIAKRKSPINSKIVKLVLIIFLALGCVLPLLSLFIWSFAKVWRFPSIFPNQFTLDNYNQAFESLLPTVFFSLILGILASGVAVIIAIFFNEFGSQTKKGLATLIAYLGIVPLIMPQISFLFGFNLFLEKSEFNYILLNLIWVHSLFCFGYAFLILKERQSRFDQRFMFVGYSLGISKTKVWLKIKLPQLMPTLKSVFGIGFSVSIALYLPTIFIAGGRYNTLMSESMALLSSFNPKISSIYAIMLTLLPLAFWGVLSMLKTKNYFLGK